MGEAGHVDMHDFATGVRDDDEREDGAEPGIVQLQEVTGPDLRRMVSEEGGPRLPGRLAGRDGLHVLLNRSLADADAELEQLAADTFGAPESIGRGHGLNEFDDLRAQRPALTLRPRPASAHEREEIAMPAQERVGIHQQQDVAPPGMQAGQDHQNEPIFAVEARPSRPRACEHKDLLAEEGVLGHQAGAGPDGVETGRPHERNRCAGGPQQALDVPAKLGRASADGAERIRTKWLHMRPFSRGEVAV